MLAENIKSALVFCVRLDADAEGKIIAFLNVQFLDILCADGSFVEVNTFLRDHQRLDDAELCGVIGPPCRIETPAPAAKISGREPCRDFNAVDPKSDIAFPFIFIVRGFAADLHTEFDRIDDLVFQHIVRNTILYAQTGADYKTIWKLKDNGHYAKAGTRQLVYFGDNAITDFTLEVEVLLEGATGSSSTAGIVFHARNYASSPHDSYTSIQGYYLALSNNTVVLERLNYADDSEPIASDAQTIQSDVYYKLKIQARGNVITVWLNDEQVFEVMDDWAFANGKVGLYTNGAAVIFRNLKISS